MVLGNVRDQCYVRIVDAETTAQQAAARCFQDRDIHICLTQHHPCAAGPGPVIVIDYRIVYRDPVGATQSDHLAGSLENMFGDSSRGRLAIGTSDDARRYIVNGGPVDFRRVREFPEWPGLRTRTQSNGHLIVIPQE